MESGKGEMDVRQAAQYGNVERLQQMLDSGECTANWLDADDCSLLHWAAINNRVDVSRLLLQRGCNVNAVGGILVSTPLHWAARLGHIQMVALLVTNGAELHLKDVEGFTPLHVAVQFGRTATAAYLIAAGQSVDEMDDTMMTPLIWAAYKVYASDPLHMIILMGADLSHADGTYHNTALHWATIHGNHCAIKILIKFGADLTSRNRDNETPRDIALRLHDAVSLKMIERAERQKRLRPSTFMQSIKEDHRSIAKLVAILPLVLLIAFGSLLNSNWSYVMKGTQILITAACVVFISRLLPSAGCLLLLPFGLAAASKLLLIFTWFIYLHPYAGWHMQIIFFVLSMSIPLVFIRIVYSDPGIITVTYERRCEMIREVWEHQQPDVPFCTVCLIRRPRRCKHCSVCNTCIQRFDHHCPWIVNCVGGNNRLLFLIYLVLIVLSTFLMIIGVLKYVLYKCDELSSKTILFCDPWVTYIGFISLFHFIWVGVLLVLQTYSTLRERAAWEELSSAVDQREENSQHDFSFSCYGNVFLRQELSDLYNRSYFGRPWYKSDL